MLKMPDNVKNSSQVMNSKIATMVETMENLKGVSSDVKHSMDGSCNHAVELHLRSVEVLNAGTQNIQSVSELERLINQFELIEIDSLMMTTKNLIILHTF